MRQSTLITWRQETGLKGRFREEAPGIHNPGGRYAFPHKRTGRPREASGKGLCHMSFGREDRILDRPRGPTSPDETIGGGSFQTRACEPQIGASARRPKAAYEGFERSAR